MLTEVSHLVGDQLFNQVFEFATEKLSKEDWLNQYIGMVTLGSAVSGPSP